MTPPHDPSRRRLVVLGGATALATSLDQTLWSGVAEGAVPRVPRRVLGKTKQSIPILLLGGGSGFKGSFDGRIKTALDYGVNYIDTARKYASGRSEPHAAVTLHALKAREKTWITSKTDSRDAAATSSVMCFSRADLARGVSRSRTKIVDSV